MSNSSQPTPVGDLVLRLFTDAQDRFSEVVSQIDSNQWHLSTPCTDWDVRALVNHLVGEQVWAPPLVAGKTLEEVGDQFDGDLLGPDPQAKWTEAARESRAAFSDPGALDGSVHTSMGSQPTADYLFDMTCDLIAHRWDLGQAIGRPQTFSSDEIKQLNEAQQRFAPFHDDLVKAGIFAAPVSVAPDADAQTRALAAIGRAL